MRNQIEEFKKTKNFLICVDSDGCVMDTMDAKHIHAFGPEAVNVWELHHMKDRFLELWNEINLYTGTRGINRFKGVVTTFQALEEEGVKMPDISSFTKWTETTNELSNPSLERAIAETNDAQLKKALEWSNAVNRTIDEKLAGNEQPFEGAKEGLEEAAKVANVAVVSSANGATIADEWTRHELTTYVDVMCGQEIGSKAYCIEQLKSNNYEVDSVLKVGDSPGDLEAAEKNGVLFYPILARKEKFSWDRFREEALGKFLDGSFRGDYQQKLIAEFKSNLQ